MPKTQKNSKRQSKKRPKSVQKGLSWVCPFPTMMSSKFRYTTAFSLTEASVGTGSFYVWNANSLFDPDVTSTGHQPLYYDQLLASAGPYQRFCVTHVHIQIDLLTLGTSQIAVGIYPQVGATDGPTLERLIEKPGVVWKVLPPASATNRTALSLSVPISKLFGVPSRALIADDTYQGFWNANPSRLASLIFAIYSMTGAATVGSVTGIAQLKYSAKLFGLSAVGSS
jgi:hypothetical protein